MENNQKKKKRGVPVALLVILATIGSLVESALLLTVSVGTVYTVAARNGAFNADGGSIVVEGLPDSEGASADGLMSAAGLQKLAQIKSVLESEFLFDQPDTNMDDVIIKAYVNSYNDPYTVYYTAEEYTKLQEDMQGSFTGLGIVVTQDPDTGVIKIVRPYHNTPAEEAGMQAEDIIYKVNGEEVTGKDLNLVVADMRGEEGTSVDLTIYRPSENRYIDMTVTRRRIQIEYISSKMLDDRIGYIEMTSFTDTTYDQFMEAYNDLKSQGMQALVVDIRDNGGGLLSSVCNILDDLLPKGIITYTEDRNGNRENYESDAECEPEIPMAVLVNGNSASASEIFTGALQDYKKATIVGTQTFGKGIVQVIYSLGDGTGVKLTTSRYYTPNGVCIHGEGITPDIVIENDKDTAEDEQLNAAIGQLEKDLNK